MIRLITCNQGKMIRYIALIFIIVVVGMNDVIAQGTVCADPMGITGADPFCSNVGIVFPNCNAANTDCTATAETGPNYGCLFDQPFPAWYYLQIENPGDMTFTIRQTQNEDGTGTFLDVDFIC